MDKDSVAAGVAAILNGLGMDLTDPNLRDTPKRVSRMYAETLAGHQNLDGQIDQILSATFPSKSQNMILVQNIEAFSMCPHHMLPVHYNVHVAYLPSSSVVGLSKLSRLVNVLAKRLVIQEQLTQDIVTTLMRIPGCRGAACLLEGVHYCMVMRGVRQSQTETKTVAFEGVFLLPAHRDEFFQMLGRG